MKSRAKKLTLTACAVVALTVLVWFAPGPIEGAYRPGPQSAGSEYYLVYLSGGHARIYMRDDRPPLDAGEYKRSSRGWEWVSEPAKVVTVVEPHLLYMRCKQDNEFTSSLSFRELRFWRVWPVLTESKQQKVRQEKPDNPAGAGNGGLTSALHSRVGFAAVPDQHRSISL